MTIIRILIAGVLATAPAACSKSSSDSASKTETETETASPPGGAKASPPAPSRPAVTAEAIGRVMAPYETCRALLAADKTDGVAACATDTQTAATRAADTAPSDVKPHLTAIATAAAELAASADDLDAARLAFGEVSKSVVALLTAVPEAASTYHVFECPMAKGFKRWAQSDAKLANPYMGTAMLDCGSEVHDHHAGGGMHGGDMPHRGNGN